MKAQRHITQTREQRAQVFFALYAQAGPTRSLESLRATATALALPVNLSTLKAYSVDYGWAARAAELDAEREALEASPAAVVATMNEEQANLGAVLRRLASAGAAALTSQTAFLGPLDVARLAKVGVDIERLARGEATSRSEIAVRVYSELVEAFVVLFDDSTRELEAADRDKVRRTFALGADALVMAHMEGSPLDVRAVVAADALPPPEG